MSLAMSKAEREAFLADTHVAVLSVADEGRGPLSVPIWYRYEPGGELRIVAGGSSRKVDLVRRAARATVCAQTETPPYRYVTVEGPARFDDIDFERDVRDVAIRYLGTQLGETYLAATVADHAEAVLIALRPERWWSADFGKWGG
jgi:hypothetical protein